MHGEHKPAVCKEEHCWGTKLIAEWELLKENKMTLVTEVFE